jgi:hypothetical protein
MWRTIPRLPERYPMSTRYYQALFDGELGFEEIYRLSTPPRLGPFVVDDQAADESFTVYDHPQPIIFKKTRQLSDAEWETLLGNEWQAAIHSYIGQPTLLMRLRGWRGPIPNPQSPIPNLKTARKSLYSTAPWTNCRWWTTTTGTQPPAVRRKWPSRFGGWRCRSSAGWPGRWRASSITCRIRAI